MNKRPGVGITYAVSGKIIYHFNGKSYISDRQHILVIPAGIDYYWDCVETGWFTVLNFKCNNAVTPDNFISIPIDDPSAFLRTQRELEQLNLSNSPSNHLNMLMTLYRMLILLTEVTKKAGILPIVKSAVEIIERDYSNPQLSICQIADSTGLSEVYFRRLFKNTFGISPQQYLQKYRIKRSINLLLQGNCSITEIAMSCGYTSLYHYCKIFKKETNCTPTNYRSNAGL